MNEALKMAIEKVMKNNHNHKNSEGIYSIDIYADYRDELEKSSLIEIGKNDADSIREEFYSKFRLDEVLFSEEDALCSLIKKEIDDEFDTDYDEIREWILENVVFNFPYDHYLKQSVCVNVSVDTGESNYDYTLNNLVEYSQGKHWKLSDEGSLVWLIKQQGYNKHQAKKAIKNPDLEQSKFLKSVFDESNNVTTHMNQLVFFVKMSLGEFINLVEDPKDLTVKKNIRCGLIDFWNGAGSILEISLEKNVVIPANKLKLHIDGAVGYSVSEIYGIMDSFWKQ